MCPCVPFGCYRLRAHAGYTGRFVVVDYEYFYFIKVSISVLVVVSPPLYSYQRYHSPKVSSPPGTPFAPSLSQWDPRAAHAADAALVGVAHASALQAHNMLGRTRRTRAASTSSSEWCSPITLL